MPKISIDTRVVYESGQYVSHPYTPVYAEDKEIRFAFKTCLATIKALGELSELIEVLKVRFEYDSCSLPNFRFVAIYNFEGMQWKEKVSFGVGGTIDRFTSFNLNRDVKTNIAAKHFTEKIRESMECSLRYVEKLSSRLKEQFPTLGTAVPI